MDSLLLSIDPSDPLWIAIAFVCGLFFRMIRQPPLIGFLLAGFLLNALGAEGGEFLGTTADLGITLLLFSIGLKLRPQSLMKPEVWGVTAIHMLVVTVLISAIVFALTLTGLSLFSGLDLETIAIIGFALSFSSTVFAVKTLDELGAGNSSHGRIAVGVLVVQDIAAVIFLAASTGKVPSVWALSLLLLIPARPVLHKLLEKTGHGELLVLFGITLALGGADLFELVGMKGDVGALIIGMLLANHTKANEMAKALLSFKDLFLVGFFLSVGMTALPGWQELIVAMIFIVILPIKVALFFGLFNIFYLRASTSWRTSLNLANYSEFGLIVGAIAVSQGLLPKEWLAVFAIALSLSFMISAPLISIRDSVYQRWRETLKQFERSRRLTGEEDLDMSHAKVIIFGMGRMGSAAYRAIENEYSDRLIGVEVDAEKAEKLCKSNFNIVVGDATNPDFWTRTPGLTEGLELVLLTLPNHHANMDASMRLRELGFKGKIAATSKFKDQQEELETLGIDMAFNIYTEAGVGFANELKNLMK